MANDTSSSQDQWQPPQRGWFGKFRAAFRGVMEGVHGQSSFMVHIPVALLVILLAAVLQLDLISWAVLLLCVGSVLSAELFNSGLEWICQAITREESPEIRKGLDIASGAVLMVSIFSAIVGAMIFVFHLVQLWDW